MARAKNEHGLTHQQELFCQYVVDAYGNNPKGILVNAYRMAYNCKSDSKDETHYSCASRLMNDRKITARIAQLRQEAAKPLTITREQMIADDVRMLELDPLELWIQDPKTGSWRMRYMHEIPQSTRKLLKFVRVGKRMYPDIDKDAARKRLIDVLGLSSKDVNITANASINDGAFRIGFSDLPE